MKPLRISLAGLICPLALLAAPNPQATPASDLKVLNGYKVDLLYSPNKATEGSWVSMAVDGKGRLIVSPQADKQPLIRITIADGRIAKMEKIELPVGSSMGMLYAFDSLYVSGNGKNGLGLYRLRDTDNDDQYDQVDFLRKIEGAAGEHGSHALVLGPDKMIYYMHGNFVKLPADLSSSSPHRNYADDQVLPRAEDGNGFGANNKPPGGFILRMDPDAKNVEMIASGMRNTYDFDFSPEGEMFCFDSDMEWDWGTPWYRPTRVYHLVSGGDYGFREGTAKWPKSYHDGLPPVVDIGIGSPTGVKFGTKSTFPAKYKKALYIMDWTYGRIIAVHLKPEGATYTGTFENFVQGKPLNVTDMEFGLDGALYFATGGRNTQSGLYRVSYEGAQSPASTAEQRAEKKAAEARALRHQLEAFHGKSDPKAVDFAWPHLNSDDRFIRYAARIAVESQDVSLWQDRALKEKKQEASLTALLALARLGNKNLQSKILDALYDGKGKLSEPAMLELLRVTEVALARMGPPSPESAQKIVARLNPQYPAKSEALNRELAQVLIALQAPEVVKKTMALIAAAQTQEEQIHYIFHLRNLRTGWSMDDRKRYFAWFNRNNDKSLGEGTYPGGAGYYVTANPLKEQKLHAPEVTQWFKDVSRDYGDGASFPKFIINIAKDAIASLNDQERTELAPLIAAIPTEAPKRAARQRKLVKEWTMADLTPVLDQASKGRSFAKGKEAYVAAQCLACHKFGNDGGAIGPDLTAVSSRFTRADVLSAIIEPSRVVSDQYQNITVYLKNGDDVTGRLLEETPDKLVLMINPLTNQKTTVARRDVQKREPSKLSPMPEGLVNILTKEEILDLLAYMESGGKQSAAAFTQK